MWNNKKQRLNFHTFFYRYVMFLKGGNNDDKFNNKF